MVLERYFKRKSESINSGEKKEKSAKLDVGPSDKSDKAVPISLKINYESLETDPGKRPSILHYPPNIRDQVRREYIQRGPCQPHEHDFPLTQCGKKARKFNREWFKKYPNWLEYSISNDAAYFLCCYLFRPCVGKQSGGESFVGKGFSNWRRSEILQGHVGGHGSAHNSAFRDMEALRNQKQNIENIILRRTDQALDEYRTRLTASVDCIRFLLRQGLPFLGHDESEESRNRGNFLELLHFLADHNDEVRGVTFHNAAKNLKLTCPEIQKDIVHAAASLTTNAIVDDRGDSLFSILVDESRDVSVKEQMAVVFRYVDKRGKVMERFVGIEHVSSTTAVSLKETIDKLLSRHKLSISRLRGQGFDGASNMQGKLNDLKTLILKKNPCAFFVHCFAHQLQLALVHVAKHHSKLASFFWLVGSVVNIVCASPKRFDILQDIQVGSTNRAVESGECVSGQGLNQQNSLVRPTDTRWGSYYRTLARLVTMFSSVVEVLEKIVDDPSYSEQKGEAGVLLSKLQSFEVVFELHLMIEIFGATDDLSKALQRKDQDIVNAMNLLRICKECLQTMREHNWDTLLKKVMVFCGKHKIDTPNMDDMFRESGRSRRTPQEVTNLHHYCAEIFYSIIDMQLHELNGRFNEVNTNLLLCVACLCPNDLFVAFDKQRLIKLAGYYPRDFSAMDIIILESQLDTYIIDTRSNEAFKNLKGIGALAEKMVETKRNDVYQLVYLLITLALILPVATVSVERVFSSMNIIKTRLRNRTGDQWMNDSMIVYIEKDIFDCIDNECILQYFENMKSRRH